MYNSSKMFTRYFDISDELNDKYNYPQKAQTTPPNAIDGYCCCVCTLTGYIIVVQQYISERIPTPCSCATSE